MVIDTALVAVLITIILALLSFSAWVGGLHQKVRSNRYDIEYITKEFKSYQIDNKADHSAIVAKLDKIITNGKKR